MRTTFIVLAILAGFSAFSQNVTKKEIKVFCNDFSSVIASGDLNKAMNFLDKDYVKTQHDEFLEGRTDQFFSELLAGEDKNGDFTVPSIKEIKSIKTGKISLSEDNGAEITFIIILKNGTKIKSEIHLETESKDSMAFVGAVG